MSEILHEQVLSLKEAARLPFLRRGGKPMAFSTIWRWSLKGCAGVRLETVRIGGRTATSIEAVERFIERLSSGTPAPITTSTPGQRTRRQAKAEDRLEAAGIL
jgi:hypothetical protein